MISHDELTIPEAAEALQLSEREVRRLIQQGTLRSRRVAGREVIAAGDIHRYWYASAVAQSEAVAAAMDAEDERLGRAAEERILNRALRSVPFPFLVLPRGCTMSFLVLLLTAALAVRGAAFGRVEQGVSDPVVGRASPITGAPHHRTRARGGHAPHMSSGRHHRQRFAQIRVEWDGRLMG